MAIFPYSLLAIRYSLNSSDGVLRSTSFGLSNDLVVPGDYDGDGKTDIAVWRPNTADATANFFYFRLTKIPLAMDSAGEPALVGINDK